MVRNLKIIILFFLTFTSVFSQDEFQDKRWNLIDTVPNPRINWRIQYAWRDIKAIDTANCIVLGMQTNIVTLIRKTEDGGKTWRSVTLDSSFVVKGKVFERIFLFGLCYPSKNLVLAYGFSPYIMRSTDNGETWKKVIVSDTTQKAWWINMKDDKLGVACGAKKVMKTTDGGETWHDMAIPIVDTQYVEPGAGFMINENKIVMSGFLKSDEQKGIYNYAICRTEDGGKTWSSFLFTDQPEPDEPVYGKEYAYISYCVNDLKMLDDSIGLCIGLRKTEIVTDKKKAVIRRTTDGGKTWKVIMNRFFCSEQGLSGSSYYNSKHGLLFGEGDILRTTDGGETFIEECVDPNGIAIGNFVAVMVSPTKAFGANRIGAIYEWLGPETKGVTEPSGVRTNVILPNPIKKGEAIDIRFFSDEPQRIRIELYNAIGQKIDFILPDEIMSKGEQRFRISKELETGVYMLKIQQNGRVSVEKFVVN